MKKIALYCRVSTALQEQEKTIQSQIAELREVWKDHQVVHQYSDDGWSGETLNRPALDQLRNDAKESLFDILSVHSMDRLSRRLYHQGILVEEFKKYGVEIFIGDKPIADTPEGNLVFNVLGAAAQYEREKILERTRRGRNFKAKQKGLVGHIPPYGYDYTKKTSEKEGCFTISKGEAETVDLIFNLYIKFQSITRVQKELALKRIKTRKGNDAWCRSTIGDALRDSVYIGVGYYGKHQSIEVDNGKKYRRKAKTGSRLRDRKEWIPLKFPVIIDKDRFKLAQQILSKKYKPFGKSKYFYLLGGLIRCLNCSSTFVGSKTGRNFYYRCSNRRKRLPLSQNCHVKFMRAGDLDSAVWSAISKAVMNPKILISHILHLADKVTRNEGVLKKEKERLLQEKNSLTAKKKRLDDLYYKELKTLDEYKEQINEFNQEGGKIDEKIRDIETKLTQIINRPLIIKYIKYFCSLAGQKLRNFNPEQRQRFLRFLLDEINLDSDKRKAKILGHIPIEDIDLQTVINPQLQSGTLSMALKVCANH